jgi:hypothetical protein
MSYKNQGEGNREAAREYNKNAEETAKSGKVEEKAEEARDAVEGYHGDDLKQAEETGRSKARG